MLNIFAAYYTDESLENNGSWQDIPGGARLLVAREGNPAYVKLLGEMFDLHGANLDGDSEAAKELNKKVMAEVVAKTILKGWEGVSFDGKTSTPYTVENATKALMMKDFYAVVMRIATDIRNYRGKIEQEQTKN